MFFFVKINHQEGLVVTFFFVSYKIFVNFFFLTNVKLDKRSIEQIEQDVISGHRCLPFSPPVQRVQDL